jgi:hypothetical protein
VHKAILVLRVPRVTRVLRERLALRARRAILVLRVLRERLVRTLPFLVLKVLKGIPDLRAPKGIPDLRVLRGIPDRKALRVIPVLKDRREQLGQILLFRVRRVLKGILVLRVPRGILGHKEIQALRVHRVIREHKGRREIPERRDRKGILALVSRRAELSLGRTMQAFQTIIFFAMVLLFLEVLIVICLTPLVRVLVPEMVLPLLTLLIFLQIF